MPQPPIKEQRAIADFLERETAKIDSLIAKQEELIQRVEEKRRATWARAICGQRQGGAYDLSSNAWLGEVPNKWRVIRSSRVFSLFSGYAFSSEFFSREDSDAPVLVTPGNFDEEGQLITSGNGLVRYTGVFDPKFALHRGDLVIVMTDLSYKRLILGRAAFVEHENLLLNQRIGKVIRRSEAIDSRFLRYALNSDPLREQVLSTAQGATVFHSSPEKIGSCLMPVPPRREQTKIADYLDEVTAGMQRLKKQAESAIMILSEHRTALITAAVTGQIEVASRIALEAAE